MISPGLPLPEKNMRIQHGSPTYIIQSMKKIETRGAPGRIPVDIVILSPRSIRPGGLAVAASDRGVREIWLHLDPMGERETLRRFRKRLLLKGLDTDAGAGPGARAILRRAAKELEAYFSGRLREFSVPLDLDGRGSGFDSGVWRSARAIPYGATASYGDLARAVGNPKAGRAVGAALGRNPVPPIVPCHRILGKDGSLTGFTGGLRLKSLLLSLEGIEGKSHKRRDPCR